MRCRVNNRSQPKRRSKCSAQLSPYTAAVELPLVIAYWLTRRTSSSRSNQRRTATAQLRTKDNLCRQSSHRTDTQILQFYCAKPLEGKWPVKFLGRTFHAPRSKLTEFEAAIFNRFHFHLSPQNTHQWNYCQSAVELRITKERVRTNSWSHEITLNKLQVHSSAQG